MKTRLALGIATAAIAALTLAGCSSDGGDDSTATPTAAEQPTDQPAPEESPSDDASEAPAAGTGLATAETDLGTIVVDGAGLTVYMFDNDTQGGDSSACDSACLGSWPPVPGSADVALAGVTGTAGTITATDGSTQLTLNGWPLYYWAGDSAPGDVNGQAVGNVWWVLDPAGEPIR